MDDRSARSSDDRHLERGIHPAENFRGDFHAGSDGGFFGENARTLVFLIDEIRGSEITAAQIFRERNADRIVRRR